MSYPDAYVHYWGEVFAANRLLERFNIRFDTFLDAPERVLQAAFYGRPMPLPIGQEHYGLLPRQARVQAMLEAVEMAENLGELIEDELNSQECDLHLRDGALVEPLHHYRFAPYSKQRSLFRARVET